MAVMTCPHCEEGIDKIIRTGEQKYPCSSCNMVVSYDDVEPYLDELEVDDKRGNSGNNNAPPKMTDDLPPPPAGGGEDQSNTQSTTAQQPPTNSGGINEREKIYQRGTEGLKQIKKGRLKNWLGHTDGVGAQTEQRITMVFNRNESVHKNPHVLYNLLDDELNASASYINTMVQDIFAPEEEHSDLLQSQGYTPWFNRGGPSGGGQQRGGFGGPMNATGSTGFNPNGQQQQPQNQQQPAESMGDENLSRSEAEVMMRQAMDQANQNNQRGALMDGLSDATDEAVREMASNVGGLAGTVHRVIDEALVNYARENPEWVIENMGVLQKILNATEDMDDTGGSSSPSEPEQNARVDNALDNIDSDTSSQATQQSTQTNQQSTQRQTPENTQNNTEQHTTDQDPNPDIGDELLSESGFEPQQSQTLNEQSDTVDDVKEGKPEPKPTPQGDTSEDTSDESESDDSDNQTSDEGFDEIFGDVSAE